MSRSLKIGGFTIRPETISYLTFSEEHFVGDSKKPLDKFLQQIQSDTQDKYEPQLFKYKRFAGEVYPDGFSIVPTPYRIVGIHAVGRVTASNDGTHLDLTLKPGTGWLSLQTATWLAIAFYFIVSLLIGSFVPLLGTLMTLGVAYKLQSTAKYKVMTYISDILGVKFNGLPST